MKLQIKKEILYFCPCVIALCFLSLSSVYADLVIIGHRGGDSIATPENTSICIKDSFAKGLSGHELDVRKTEDGDLVVLHDATVDRTTNGTGTVDELNTAYVRNLDAGSWKDAKFAGEKVPFLSEALTLIKGNGTRAYLDIKNATAADVRASVDAAGFPEVKLTFLTFYDGQSTSFINEFPQADVYYSFYGFQYNTSSRIKTVNDKLLVLQSLGVKGVTVAKVHFSQDFSDAVHGVYLKMALVGPRVDDDSELDGYILSGVDELWLDDIKRTVGEYNDGLGHLKKPEKLSISKIEINKVDGDVVIEWHSKWLKHYRVEESIDMLNWNTLESDLVAGVGRVSFYRHDEGGYLINRFYRVVELED